MFTLKIRWWRFDSEETCRQGEIADENTLFIAADEIQVGAPIKSLSEMKAWEEGQFLNYAVVNPKTEDVMESRLIQVIRNGVSSWYLASAAWLLGPDGKTIERLTA